MVGLLVRAVLLIALGPAAIPLGRRIWSGIAAGESLDPILFNLFGLVVVVLLAGIVVVSAIPRRRR